MRLQKEGYVRSNERFSAILLGIMLTLGGGTMAQQSIIDALKEAARSAQSGDPAAIRMLTDTVVVSALNQLSASLKLPAYVQTNPN